MLKFGREIYSLRLIEVKNISLEFKISKTVRLPLQKNVLSCYHAFHDKEKLSNHVPDFYLDKHTIDPNLNKKFMNK